MLVETLEKLAGSKNVRKQRARLVAKGGFGYYAPKLPYQAGGKRTRSLAGEKYLAAKDALQRHGKASPRAATKKSARVLRAKQSRSEAMNMINGIRGRTYRKADDAWANLDKSRAIVTGKPIRPKAAKAGVGKRLAMGLKKLITRGRA